MHFLSKQPVQTRNLKSSTPQFLWYHNPNHIHLDNVEFKKKSPVWLMLRIHDATTTVIRLQSQIEAHYQIQAAVADVADVHRFFKSPHPSTGPRSAEEEEVGQRGAT